MGIAELIRLMQELYQQAEAQLAHVEPLSRSRQAWEAVLTGLQDTEALLRQKSGEIGPGWPDEAGQLYAERLDRSSITVQGWQQTLAAADIPALVTDLAAAVRATVDAVRAQWERFVALIDQLGAIAAGPAAVAAVEAITAQLAAIVEETATILRELDARFAAAAERITSAVDGTPWDGPAAAGAAAGAALGADGATMMAAGPAAADAAGATAAGAGPTATGAAAPGGPGAGAAEPLAGAGAAPAAAGSIPEVAPVGAGQPGLAGAVAPTPVGLPSSGAPLAPVASSGYLPPVGAAGLIPPAGAGAGLSPIGGGAGRIPSVAGATAAAGAQMIPQAGRTITGAAPLAVASMPPAAATSAPTSAAGSTMGTGRLFPPVLGAGLHGAGGRGAGGDPKPGDQDSAHRARPVQAIPGVPPSLRGRAGTLDGTPDFLTGPRHAEESTEAPLDEDLWQATRPPSPFTAHRRR